MSASEEVNDNFVNDLRELMAKYNIQHAQMNVELINSNNNNNNNSNNKDNDTNSDHTNEAGITKEATPTLNKAHVNVIITNNEVKCLPLLSPNKTTRNTEKIVIVNTINKKTNDAENVTKTNCGVLPAMETKKMSSPVSHASHHFTDKSSTQGNDVKKEEKEVHQVENIRPYVASQPAAPLSEIPRKQEALPHSHSVSERRTHLCSPHPMSGVNIPCTSTTAIATTPCNTEVNQQKEENNEETKMETETRLGREEVSASDNTSQPINTKNLQKTTSPSPPIGINTHLQHKIEKELNTRSPEKSTMESAKKEKASTVATEKGNSTLHNVMADAAASGMAIPEDLQLHLAQEEQRQKRIAILNSFVGKSALLHDKAEREKMNAETSNGARRPSNSSKNSNVANRFMFGANRLSVSSASDANQKNNSVNDVNSLKKEEEEEKQEMVKSDKLPPIAYAPDSHATYSLPSSSHLDTGAAITTLANKKNTDDKDLINAHGSNASPATLPPHSPTPPSEKISVEIDAKLFTDICRENSRQAARLMPHLSESFAPVTNTGNNKEIKTNEQGGRGSASGLKEMLKEQQNMEMQSREELLKHAELMAKAKAVIDHADHIEYRPRSSENKIHQSNRNSVNNSATMNTTTSASLPYSLTRNPHNDITAAQNNAKVAESNAENNNTNANTTSFTSAKRKPSVNEKITPTPPPLSPQSPKVNANAESAKSTISNNSSNYNSNDRTLSAHNALEEKQQRKSQIELVSITLPQANPEARSEAINRFAKEPTLIQYLQGKDKYDALLASQQKELAEHQKDTKSYKELVNQAVQFNKKIGIK